MVYPRMLIRSMGSVTESLACTKSRPKDTMNKLVYPTKKKKKKCLKKSALLNRYLRGPV